MKTLPLTKNPLRTRDDVQTFVRDLVEPVTGFFSAGRAQVCLGANRALYGDPAGLMEGFTRPLWGLIPLAAGGGTFAHWDLWRAGFDAGTNPDHAEYWGTPGDFDQRSVESGALGFALALWPEELWEKQPPAAQARIAAWLQKINDVRLVDSNWLFFRVLVNLGLQRVGQTWSRERLEGDLDRLDQFYLGDGWYSDGISAPPFRDGRRGDYYVPMAFHFYGLLYARLEGAADPVRASRYVERARRFAQDFVHWFADDGSALPFGRSLTYRFAQVAFWGALAHAPVEALPWPVVKGLYLRHLRWWLRQPIFSETGLLTIGYAYPNLTMAESYNSSGSPYWALKAFLPLALSGDHPFWQADEAPLPPRRLARTVAGANLVLVTTPAGRDVVALNPGQPVEDWPRHAPQKYSKFVYSTRFGFCVPTSSATPQEGAFDSMLALSDDRRRYRVREHCFDPAVGDGVAYSRWQPWPHVDVETWLLAAGEAHVRVHRIKSARPLWSVEGGFAAPYTVRASLGGATPAEGVAVVRTPAGCSALRDLGGSGAEGTAKAGLRTAERIEVGASGHLLMSLSALPLLRGVHDGPDNWLACVVVGGGPDLAPAPALAEYQFECDGGVPRVLRDGAVWWTWRGSDLGESSPGRLEQLARRV